MSYSAPSEPAVEEAVKLVKCLREAILVLLYLLLQPFHCVDGIAQPAGMGGGVSVGLIWLVFSLAL